VVLGLLLLTGVVGSLFMLLGPKALETNPGVLHVGVRYLDERSMAFTRHPKGGPGARLDFVAPDGSVPYSHEALKIGRNLVPIGPEQLPPGPYTARLSAPGYRSVELPVVIEGRMLNPAPKAELPPHSHADYNMLGVRFQPAEDSKHVNDS
ncbi:MAG: hypothetical protein ACLFVC_03820, partial [Opitutales bacterium]